MTRASRRVVRAYVGSFTTQLREARGDGINVFEIDPSTGRWTHIQNLREAINPSFFRINRAGTRLYTVHADLEYASAFAIDPASGLISPLGSAATGGANGVSLALDPTNRFLVVVNYVGGNVAALPIAADGSLRDFATLLPLSGTPRLLRRVGHQEGSHPHDVTFDPSGRFVVIAEKGLDGVFVYRFEQGQFELSQFAQARAGAAPRHIAFHPRRPIAWVCNELEATVTTYRWDAKRGQLTPIDHISTLPPEFTQDSLCAEIGFHDATGTLYVSNRGHESLTMFRVGRDLMPRPFGWQSVRGSHPRFFAFDPSGSVLYVANERSDTIVPFKIDKKSGRLSPGGEPIRVASPATIAFTAPSRGK